MKTLTLEVIANLRANVAKLKEAEAELQGKLNANPVYRSLNEVQAVRAQNEKLLAEIEAKARETLAEGWEPGMPKKQDGYTIQEKTTVIVTDDLAAKKWAVENMPDSVTLKADVAKVAGRIGLKWTKSFTEIRAAIASDLTAFLNGGAK